jgi:hypothetical protein
MRCKDSKVMIQLAPSGGPGTSAHVLVVHKQTRDCRIHAGGLGLCKL